VRVLYFTPSLPGLLAAWRQAHWVLGFSVVKSMKSTLLQLICPHSADCGNSNSGVALLVLIAGRNIEPKFQKVINISTIACVWRCMCECVCVFAYVALISLFCDIIGPSRSTGR